MAGGIRVKVDEKSKSSENDKVEKTKSSEVESPVADEKKAADYAFISKDKDGRLFLLPETGSELEKMHEARTKLESELSLVQLQEKCLEKDKEILVLKGQILDRELNDLKTVKTFKVEQRKRENQRHAEYMDKIRREVGHKTFGLSEEDEILIGATTT